VSKLQWILQDHRTEGYNIVVFFVGSACANGHILANDKARSFEITWDRLVSYFYRSCAGLWSGGGGATTTAT